MGIAMLYNKFTTYIARRKLRNIIFPGLLETTEYVLAAWKNNNTIYVVMEHNRIVSQLANLWKPNLNMCFIIIDKHNLNIKQILSCMNHEYYYNYTLIVYNFSRIPISFSGLENSMISLRDGYSGLVKNKFTCYYT